MRFWKYSNSENYLIFKHYFVEAWYTLHICGISVYEGKSVTFNHFDCNLNKKGSINVKFDFKINLIIISVVSLFWPNSIWWYIINYLFLGKRSFASTYKEMYESKNVCVKKLQRTCCYFSERRRNYTKHQQETCCQTHSDLRQSYRNYDGILRFFIYATQSRCHC